MSLPTTPREWAERKARQMVLRDWIDAALAVAFVVFAAWCAGRWMP